MNDSYNNIDVPSIINNEFDYSNSLPTIECVSYLVKYCDNIYNQFMSLVKEDEKKNEQYKEEYKNYEYKKIYSQRFEIYIRLKSYNNIACKSFEAFETAVNDGNLTNIDSMDIRLNLDYGRGKSRNIINHENSFSIIIKPFNFVFARNSSHNESNMNQIENDINQLLNKFPKMDTIFCTKK